MLCERFHKTLKHDILGGKANVRIDSLIQLLIRLTVETEEEREVMMERGVEEGRYRLQRHHKAHAWAVKRYSAQKQRIAVVGAGKWEVQDNDKVFHVQEHYCPCDEKFNNHCLRGECKACPYAFACNCTMDVKSGISCTHVHAALFLSLGRRSLASQPDVENSHVDDYHYSGDLHGSDEEDEIVEVVMVDEPETCSESFTTRHRSTDQRDHCRDIIQKMEMSYAATRTCAFTALKNPGDGLLEKMERAYHFMEEARKVMAGVAAEATGKENNAQLARRPDVSLVGRTQAFTPIRKLHKRSHLRRVEQAKRKKVDGIPDYLPSQMDACAVCLRAQPNVTSKDPNVNWVQCEACDEWFHFECVADTCPTDGTILEKVIEL
ncbi:hypothetical protein Y032_0390g556 [Ancylostoma ceylanicum]|uniref:SWIM-type domain-containing protein n=1 Tax=Ancylostoma ceylanicum TaxID=53326 RepID=A0A016RSV2_9BILA|nr:hypothetical protein Y032_0390g556 [Ancylostoma ceylanicum]